MYGDKLKCMHAPYPAAVTGPLNTSPSEQSSKSNGNPPYRTRRTWKRQADRMQLGECAVSALKLGQAGPVLATFLHAITKKHVQNQKNFELLRNLPCKGPAVTSRFKCHADARNQKERTKG